jgi:hypothetical protein
MAALAARVVGFAGVGELAQPTPHDEETNKKNDN